MKRRKHFQLIVGTFPLLYVAATRAQSNGGLDETRTKLCGFLDNITTLLNLGSIAIVTIAIIVSGYQIAFAQKRFNDVAPLLVGGLLIGAAAQIAKMLVGNQVSCGLG